MPKQMTEDEAKAAVAEVIKSIGATGVKDMGKVMAELKAKYAARWTWARLADREGVLG